MRRHIKAKYKNRTIVIDDKAEYFYQQRTLPSALLNKSINAGFFTIKPSLLDS